MYALSHFYDFLRFSCLTNTIFSSRMAISALKQKSFHLHWKTHSLVQITTVKYGLSVTGKICHLDLLFLRDCLRTTTWRCLQFCLKLISHLRLKQMSSLPSASRIKSCLFYFYLSDQHLQLILVKTFIQKMLNNVSKHVWTIKESSLCYACPLHSTR